MLNVRGLDKWFGATHAVRTVSFDALPGSVLGLVGENGAGKSTVIKMIAGLVARDGGEMLLDGAPLQVGSPREALARGVDSVFQELALVDNLTVSENLLLLDAPQHPWGSRRRSRARRICADILARHELDIRPDDRVGDLPLGRRQMLEIVRAIHRDPRVLLLDEASSALGASEVRWLVRLVERLRAQDKIVLFISHRWEEITTFCDRVAVMRNGELVRVAESGALSQETAVELMTGHGVAEGYPPKAAPGSGTLLSVSGLRSPVLRDVSLSLAPGEVLGLGGLVGQGQSEFMRALFAAHRLEAGQIVLHDRELHLHRPDDAIRAKIAYVPQDRKAEGLFLDKSVAFNMTYALLDRLPAWLGLIQRGREREIVDNSITRLQIKTAGAGAGIKALSGGNQQKVLLQKWLLTEPVLLLLDDVTRGVDIATKQEIYMIIRAAAASGTGVILYSTDTTELVGLADTVLVMVEGGVRRRLTGEEVNAAAIVDAAIGREAAAAQLA
jgi:ribose transport system ATP-binding protein